VLPTQVVAEADAWKFAVYPFADAARGFTHMPTLRAAIRARQKLRLTYTSKDDAVTTRVVRPLHMEYWGRVWTLTAWCELREDHRVFRVDLIRTAEALPELFVDEPGKTLADFTP
ncbi:MAG: WYL domain-containing protein, partial [Roseobacter sp.]